MEVKKVNVDIEGLKELEKLLSTANELSKKLEMTIKKINETQLTIKSQVDG